MAKDLKDNSDDDIAKQTYHGPSRTAAAAGEGFVAHFKWAFLGLALGGIATAIFHKNVSPLVDKLRAYSLPHLESKNWFTKTAASLSVGVFGHGKTAVLSTGKIEELTEEHRYGFGLWMLNHLPFIKHWIKETKLKNPELTDRLNLAVTGGGMFAFLGYAVLPWFLAGKGYEKAARGKHQFERAKEEIWSLRAENDQLRERNGDLKVKLADAQTVNAADESAIHVSKDNPQMIGNHDNIAADSVPEEAQKKEQAKSPEEPTPTPEPATTIAAPGNEKPTPSDKPAKTEQPVKGDAQWSDAVRTQQAAADKEAALA